jgi:hypothetical protein
LIPEQEEEEEEEEEEEKALFIFFIQSSTRFDPSVRHWGLTPSFLHGALPLTQSTEAGAAEKETGGTDRPITITATDTHSHIDRRQKIEKHELC